MSEHRARMSGPAAMAWFCMSALLVIVSPFGPWETGRSDIWQLRPHVTTSGWEDDGWMLLIAVGVAVAALAAHGRLFGRLGAWVSAAIALLAGGFLVLVMAAWLSYTPISCDALFGLVCATGEDVIVTARWGAVVALVASLSLTAAMIAVLVQRHKAWRSGAGA